MSPLPDSTPPTPLTKKSSSTTIEEVEEAPTPGFNPTSTSPPPTSRKKPDPASSSQTVETSSEPAAGAAGSGGEQDTPPSSTSSTSSAESATSSPASTDPDLFVGVVRQLVALLSMGVRVVRQRQLRTALPQGIWLADDDDQANIGDPLARIAARHTPLAGGASTDVADGVEAMLGTTAYAFKHLDYEAQLGAFLEQQAAEAQQ